MNTETAAAAANPYQPPQAPLADVGSVAEESLYVVAPWKFLTMAIVTMNIYSLYWFYKNWALLNRRHQAYWPVPRAIFAVFFTHSLFEEIDGRVRRSGNTFAWSPRGAATLYVICAIVSGAASRMNSAVLDARFSQVLVLGLLAPMIFAMYRAQLAINVAEGDAQGARNSELTAANILWLVLGGMWWALVLFGTYLILTGRALAN